MKRAIVVATILLGLPLVGSAWAQKSATPSQQKVCDAQASKVYHEGRRLNGHLKEDSSGMNGYTSHFDPSTNVCYVWVHFGQFKDNTVTFADTISDAFEGRIYASYLWFTLARNFGRFSRQLAA